MRYYTALRDLAKGLGELAKTDAVDARICALTEVLRRRKAFGGKKIANTNKIRKMHRRKQNLQTDWTRSEKYKDAP